MDLWLYVAYTLLHALLAVLLWPCRPGRPAAGWTILLLVTLGLIYDNAILAGGGLIGFGPALESLSEGRFLIHALLTPLLGLYAVELLPHAGVRPSVVLRARYGVGLLTLLSMAGAWADAFWRPPDGTRDMATPSTALPKGSASTPPSSRRPSSAAMVGNSSPMPLASSGCCRW